MIPIGMERVSRDAVSAQEEEKAEGLVKDAAVEEVETGVAEAAHASSDFSQVTTDRDTLTLITPTAKVNMIECASTLETIAIIECASSTMVKSSIDGTLDHLNSTVNIEKQSYSTVSVENRGSGRDENSSDDERSVEEEEEEEPDPRIQLELEKLNRATDAINSMETELEVR